MGQPPERIHDRHFAESLAPSPYDPDALLSYMKKPEIHVPKFVTIQTRIQSVDGVMTGFDYLRIGLSVTILCWHSIWISTGSGQLNDALWSGPFRFLPASIIPMFFALSGFLVAGSLARNRLHKFALLRFLRLIPALAVEITLSAFLIGLLFTELPHWNYITNKEFYSYFLNIVGIIQFRLPGVFEHNPGSGIINGQLWTIPFELECYFGLVVLSLLTLVKRRFAFAVVVIALSLALSMWTWSGHPVEATSHVPGRMLVISFLAAVILYLYRDVVPYSGTLGVASGLLSAILLQIPNAAFLAAFPIAYFTIWIGMMRPPKIPFGDLSYGVYLFHFPIEQTVVHLFPGVQSWWLLTIISLPLTAICAWLSWTFVEAPILSRKRQILTRVDQLLLPVLQWKTLRA